MRYWNAAGVGGHVSGSHSANLANQAPVTCFSQADLQQCHAISKDGNKWYYCWTHGLGKNKTHTSATCNKPAEGHKTDATLDNMMGGCTTIMSRRRRNNTNNTAQPTTTTQG